MKITIDDLMMENLILNLLCCSKKYHYTTRSGVLEVDTDIKDKELLQRRVFNWLQRRMQL